MVQSWQLDFLGKSTRREDGGIFGRSSFVRAGSAASVAEGRAGLNATIGRDSRREAKRSIGRTWRSFAGPAISRIIARKLRRSGSAGNSTA